MKTKLLVIDDDVTWGELVKLRLTQAGFQVEVAGNVADALKKAYSFHPHIILLDLLMPGTDGRQACSHFRQMTDIPIIVLTALNSPQQMVECLDSGADDYINKTATSEELIARIRAILRRSKSPGPVSINGQATGVFAQDDLIVDLTKREITIDGKRVKLTPKEFELLSVLIKHKGRVLPHEFLLNQVWGSEYGDDMVSLRLYIGYLRRKIEKDPARPTLIQSEWGVGYRFA